MTSDTTKQKVEIESPWMTVREVAAYIKISAGTVRNLVSERRIPFARRGRLVRFHRQRIDEWMNRGACRGRVSRAPTIQGITEGTAGTR